MKRVKNLTIAMVITLLATGYGVAQDLVDVFENDNGRYGTRIIESDYSKYKLIYPLKKSESVRVRIFNLKNQLVYSEKIRNNNGFERAYDLSKLPDGQYRFEIWSSRGKISKNIIHRHEVSDLNVSLDKLGEGESFKLIVRGVQKKPVYVDIYDDRTGLIYEDTIESGKDFSRVYSFNPPLDDRVIFRIRQDAVLVEKNIK